MYIIERPPLTSSMLITGTLAEPWTGGTTPEVEWSATTWAVGAECIRASLHRVYKCATARTASNTTPPESDATGWVEVRPTARYLPFGPYTNASGQTIYRGLAVESTTSDLVWRLQLRYCNALALFGLRGARVRVQVYSTVGGTLVHERVLTLKRPASGYWDYGYGQKITRDRLLITDLPIYPAAEVVVKVEGATGQQRRITQLEYGKLRELRGASFGGTTYGMASTVRVRMYRQQDADGTEAVLLWGTAQDMSGQVVMSADRENAVLSLLRGVVGRGVAVAPSLDTGYEQHLAYGVIDAAPVKRTSHGMSSVDITLRGLPVD